MIPAFRKAYNKAYTADKYNAFLKDIEKSTNHLPPFKVAETPVFIPKDIGTQLFKACDEIVQTLVRPDFKSLTDAALLQGSTVPGETPHTTFLVVDFGLCYDTHGDIAPQLIEIQGFPSLYFYQDLCAQLYRKHFEIPEHFSHLFNDLDSESYNSLLKRIILGNSKPENVVLLEIEPHKQNTQVDFWATRNALGIKVACLTELRIDGRDVHYLDESGRKIQVERIYNRIIFDELDKRNDLRFEFQFDKEYNIEWVGHPNWFFRISKHTLPLFKSKFVPETFFLNEFPHTLDELSNYVLKPLYSFSGQGVIINPKREDVESINEHQKRHFILQKKVKYAPVIETQDENAKVEIRMMLLWEDGAPKPTIITNLARLSKGEMVGVRYNKGKTWVGGTVGFFE